MKNPYGGSLIYDQQTGQRLLGTAYVNPTKPKQLFNYHDGQVIQFKLTRNGSWQTEIIDRYVESRVGTTVLKSFKNDGIITYAEYKALLKM